MLLRWERTLQCHCMRWSMQPVACIVRVPCACARFVGMFVHACRFCQACSQGHQAQISLRVRSWSLIFVCMDYVPCGSGQTSTILSLRGPIVGVCMQERAHTGLQMHVTLFHGKRSEECCNPDSLSHQRQVLLVCSNTPRGGIAGKPNHNTVLGARLCLPPCVALCNSCSARTPCVPQPLPSHPAATVLYAAALPLLASSAAAVRLRVQTKNSEVTAGDILPDWGLSKHSALWSGC